MRGTGAEQLVVAVMHSKECGAKVLRHLVGVVGQLVRGGVRDDDKAF